MVRRCQRRRKTKSGKLFPKREHPEMAPISGGEIFSAHSAASVSKGFCLDAKKRIQHRGHKEHRQCREIDKTRVYAALVAACAAAGSSQRTDTNFETPGSCMVTPYRTDAISIVLRLCVTTMNCVPALISDTSLVKRPTLASSSGASTSSRMQNGLGW